MDDRPRTLAGIRVLLIEDEYLIADDMLEELVRLGAIVDGPISNVEDALAAVQRGGAIDAAVLDVNLRGIPTFAVADELVLRRVPFLFATGYSRGDMPYRFAGMVCCEKPFARGFLATALRAVLGRGAVMLKEDHPNTLGRKTDTTRQEPLGS